ncbi:MAG: MarR family winged helix-turn-helix transcriptional regulator [Parvibaculaceae bacterium]
MTDTKIEPADAIAMAGDLRVLIGTLNRKLREQASQGDITPSQKAVLLRLDADGPATVTTLAKGLGVRPQSMGATVSTLETAGYVSAAADPNDGRQTIWSLTPACREKILAGRAARQDWLYQTIRSKFDAGDQPDLAAGIALLKRLVDI